MRLGALRELYERGSSPYVTAWLDTSHETADADEQLALRWRALREAIAAQGCPEEDLAALENATRPGPFGGAQSRFLVASHGTVLLDESESSQQEVTIAHCGPLPHLLPWLVGRAERVPYLLVLADRLGANFTLVGADAAESAHHHDVTGTEYPIERNAPGGWSQRRYQQRAENTWEHNAALVAEETDRICRVHRPELVLVGGDVRATASILRRLSPPSRDRTVHLEYTGRAAGVSERARDAQVRDALRRRRVEHAEQLADRFEREHGRRGLAVDGLAATCASAALGQVDTLLVNTADLDPLPPLWIGPRPEQLATDPRTIAALGVDPVSERADAALVRALVHGDAAVRQVGPQRLALADGVGALLRYPNPPR